jgi:hypothetical protein
MPGNVGEHNSRKKTGGANRQIVDITPKCGWFNRLRVYPSTQTGQLQGRINEGVPSPHLHTGQSMRQNPAIADLESSARQLYFHNHRILYQGLPVP